MSKNLLCNHYGWRYWLSILALEYSRFIPNNSIDMTGEGISLMQTTFGRLEHFDSLPGDIFIVTQSRYQLIILDQLGDKLSPDKVICEPDRRNTAPLYP